MWVDPLAGAPLRRDVIQHPFLVKASSFTMCFTPVLATELGASSISGVDGCLLTVTTEKPVSGAVYLTADQSRDDFGCHGAGCHPDTMRFL